MNDETDSMTLGEVAALFGVNHTTARTYFKRGYLGENVGEGRTIRVRTSEVTAYADDRAGAPVDRRGEPLLRLRDLRELFGVRPETVASWRTGRTRTLPGEDDTDHRGYPLYRLAAIHAFAEREGLPMPGRATVLARWGK